MNKSFVAVALIAALVVGYGIRMFVSKPSPSPLGLCAVPAANKHCVDVTIVNNAIQPIALVHVPGKSQVIFWNIVTSGYTFPADGISTFTPVPPTTTVPPDEFKCGPLTNTVFFCVDVNSTHGSGAGPQTYKYTVTVNGSSPPPVVLDPQIVNN